MANKAIGDLTELTSIINNDLFVMEHSGTSYKVKGGTVLNYVNVAADVTRAEVAADRAEDAADAAEAYSTNAPYIGANDNWYTYDSETQQMADSGHSSKGQTGDTGATGADGVSPAVTITSITGGHTVTITDADHPSGQSFNVMDGGGAGDMVASTYDPSSTVANAGGIPAYVSAQIAAAITDAIGGSY